MLKLELGASEKVKEVCNLECNQLCTIAKDVKQQLYRLFARLITNVAGWETTIIKHNLIKITLQTMLKFSKSLINSLLIKQNQKKKT